MKKCKIIYGILIVLLISGCNNDNKLEPHPDYIPVVQAICNLNSTGVALFPAQNINKSTPAYFDNTEYEIILEDNGQRKYLGKFEGKVNKTFLNFTYGNKLEMLVTTTDCFAYKNLISMYVPCDTMTYITPQLECAKELKYRLVDENTFLELENETITGGTIVWIYLNFYKRSNYNHIACGYDGYYVEEFNARTKYNGMYMQEEIIRDFIVLQDYMYPEMEALLLRPYDGKEFVLEFDLTQTIDKFQTKVRCKLYDDDFFIDGYQGKNEINYAPIDRGLNDLGRKNPSFNFIIIKR